MTTFRFVRSIGFLAAALTVATPAIAFDDKTPPSTGGSQPTLRGPRVPDDKAKDNEKFEKGGRKDGAKEGEPGMRGENGRPAQRAGGFMAWVKAVKELNLSPDQKTKIEAIVAEFETKSASWKTANGEKMKELEAKAREEKRANGEASEETKKAIRDVTESRPKQPEYQKKVDDLLTDEQRTQLKANLDKARDEEKKEKREEARKKRDAAEKGSGAKDGTEGGKGGGKEGGRDKSKDASGTGR